MTDEMRSDIVSLFPKVKGAGTLDYVTGWYAKAAVYMKANLNTVSAFVSTNSISQGEQVGVLWRTMFETYAMKILFAHRTFRWSNGAKGIAAVHVVIIGFGTNASFEKHIYEYETPKSEAHEIIVKNISPYLVEGKDAFLESRSKPICNVPKIGIGNKPIDGGNYLFTTEEKDEFLRREPNAEKYFRRWLGSDEFINGYNRWCLWLGNCPPNELRLMPEVLKRIEAVKQYRLASSSAPTKKLALTPIRFHVENMPEVSYLLIPRVSSERRSVIPIGYIDKETFSSDSVHIIPQAALYHFGMLTAAMHMAWLKYTCGRLKSDYRYSKDIVYNNFPWPETPTEKQTAAVEAAAQTVLDARGQFSNSSLADLYDPATMPPVLVRAHQTLDKAVDLCYRPQPFVSETKRIEFLFELYEKYMAGLFAAEKKGKHKAGRV